MAPVDQDHIFSPETDVYMFGMTVYECFAGCAPFEREGVPDDKVEARVRAGERPAPLGSAECPPVVMALAAACWAQDPRKRRAMPEVEKVLSEWLETNGC